MNPRVKAVEPRDDYRLEITLTNGEVGSFDCTHLLSFGVFRELKDIRYFGASSRGPPHLPPTPAICPIAVRHSLHSRPNR